MIAKLTASPSRRQKPPRIHNERVVSALWLTNFRFPVSGSQRSYLRRKSTNQSTSTCTRIRLSDMTVNPFLEVLRLEKINFSCVNFAYWDFIEILSRMLNCLFVLNAQLGYRTVKRTPLRKCPRALFLRVLI